MGMGKAGQGGTEMVVWDTVGDIIWTLPSTRWRGLWLSRVTTHKQPDPTSLAIYKSLPKGSGKPAGSDALTTLSIFLSASVGEKVPGQEHKGHYL